MTTKTKTTVTVQGVPAQDSNPMTIPSPAPPAATSSGGLTPFTYSPGGVTNPNAVQVPGSDQPYAASGTPYVPYEFTKNAGLFVPGIGYQYQDGTSANAAEMASQQRPGLPMTLAQALQFELTQAQQDPQGTIALQEQLIRAGYLNPKDSTFNPGTMRSADATYHALATVFNDAVVTGTDYQTILGSRAGDPKNRLGLSYWQSYLQLTGKAPINESYTQATTNLSTFGDAQQSAESEFGKLLGRDPRPNEVSALHGALNAYERAHPQLTTHNVHIDPKLGYGGVQERSTSTTGGADANDMTTQTDNQITSNDGAELAKVQINKLVQAFESMLGSAR